MVLLILHVLLLLMMLRASMNKITRAVGMLSRSPVAVCASEAAEKVKFESLSVARAPARARSGP